MSHDGIASILRCLTHHAKVKVDQGAVPGSKQVAWRQGEDRWGVGVGCGIRQAGRMSERGEEVT